VSPGGNGDELAIGQRHFNGYRIVRAARLPREAHGPHPLGRELARRSHLRRGPRIWASAY